MNALMSVKKAAEALDISEWMVRYLLKTKQLSKIKVGSRVLIEVDDISRFIESRKQ